MRSAAVLIENPKYPHNVGGALRACHIFGARSLHWNGTDAVDPTDPGGQRLPREERLKAYRDVYTAHVNSIEYMLEDARMQGITPVCVEVLESAESLALFEHPERAVYVFGREDGGVSGSVRSLCHRFVKIPTTGRAPLNLAAAINVVLYDRFLGKENV